MTDFSIFPNHKLPFQIIAQTLNYLVVFKPATMVTQPGINHDKDSLLNAAFAHVGLQLQNLGKKRDFGLLHRLDMGTSGLILIALTIEGYEQLRALFEGHLLQKRYYVLLHGKLLPNKGIIDFPIAEKIIHGKKRAIVGEGEEAITRYRVLSSHHKASLVECEIVTGKLHQIRAHFAALSHSVIGDFDYGLGSSSALNQSFKAFARHHLALHAHQLSFTDPWTKQRVSYQAPVSEAFDRLRTELDLSF